MERDRNISKLIKESGVEPAPEGFTGEVMKKIDPDREGAAYKPLMGRGGRILIMLFIAIVAAVALFGTGEGQGAEGARQLFQSPDWTWPTLNLDLSFLDRTNFLTWLAPTVVAILILVLLDIGLLRRRTT